MTLVHTAVRYGLSVAIVGAAFGCGLHDRPKVERRQDVAGTKVGASSRESAVPSSTEAGPAGSDVVAPGIVEPWGDRIALASKEPGWIAGIVVKEGDIVRGGQLLGTLDDETERHAVNIARAVLGEAEAVLAKAVRGATSEELRQAEAELEEATARSEFARASAARISRLHLARLMADEEAERSAADARAQEALAERASARLQELRRGEREEDRNAAQARAAAARARYKLAEAELNRRTIIAPKDGTVLLSRFHLGEYYEASMGPMFVLGDMTRLQVRLEVDEIDAQDLQVGAPCTLVSDGGALLAHGSIVRLAPQMGRRSLSIESPTARADVRVREVFVEVRSGVGLVPGQRVWGRTPRRARKVDGFGLPGADDSLSAMRNGALRSEGDPVRPATTGDGK